MAWDLEDPHNCIELSTNSTSLTFNIRPVLSLWTAAEKYGIEKESISASLRNIDSTMPM